MATLEPDDDDEILGDVPDGDDEPTAIGLGISVAVPAQKYFAERDADRHLAAAQAERVEPEDEAATEAIEADHNTANAATADEALAKIDDWSEEFGSPRVSEPAPAPVRRRGSIDVPPPTKPARAQAFEPAEHGPRARTAWRAAGLAAIVALGIAVVALLGSGGSAHHAPRVKPAAAATQPKPVANAVSIDPALSAIHGLAVDAGRQARHALSTMAALARDAARHQAMIRRRERQRARQHHRAPAPVASPPSTPAATTPTSQPSSTPTTTYTAPAPTGTASSAGSSSGGSSASGSGSSSTGAASHTATHHQPAFGAYGALGPGSSSSG